MKTAVNVDATVDLFVNALIKQATEKCSSPYAYTTGYLASLLKACAGNMSKKAQKSLVEDLTWRLANGPVTR